MPFYTMLRYPGRVGFTTEERLRTAEKLLVLRKQLREEIPAKTINETLLLATWNLREFKSQNRLEESFFYIAEVIDAFDIVALQELGDNLAPLEEVMKILGPDYKLIMTDVTEGDEGKQERLGFIYDSRKVFFKDIAGEIVLPRNELLPDGIQFARTPYIVAFQARWFRFMLCNVHILYGKSEEARIAEIKAIADYIIKKASQPRKDKRTGYNYILLGDFNINNPEDKTMKPLLDAGYKIPPQLEVPSNIGKEKKYYDQIAFKPQPDELILGNGLLMSGANVVKTDQNAGVFNYYNSVFTEKDFGLYEETYLKKKEKGLKTPLKEYYLKSWRTFQMSDHLPKWVELRIDFSDKYLDHCKTKIKTK